jgi:hypothetical protein
MFTRSLVAAFFRTLQRPLVALFALALLANAWSLGPGGGCVHDAGCASSPATSNAEDYTLALVGALEGAEDAKTDIGTSEDTLFAVVVTLQSPRLWHASTLDSARDANNNRNHVLPEKTGPPSSLPI